MFLSLDCLRVAGGHWFGEHWTFNFSIVPPFVQLSCIVLRVHMSEVEEAIIANLSSH